MAFQVHLVPDRRCLRDVGVLSDGSCFWIDIQQDSNGRDTRDFLVTYFFDQTGVLTRHEILDLGWRSQNAPWLFGRPIRKALKQQRDRLGPHRRQPIRVMPFTIEEYGTTFGLEVRDWRGEEEPENGPYVDALPGHTLMFYPPWDKGHYAS